MYENTIEYPSGKITIKLEYDPDPSSPDEMGDCEPEFFRAQRGEELDRKLNEEFQHPIKAMARMTSGEVFEDKDGSWFYGFSEYRHGQSAFAFCNSSRARNFPDQQWDVIQLVGWIKISKKLREDWGIVDDKKLAKAKAVGYLKTWEAYLNGEVYGCILQVLDAEEKVLEEDSCWGYYGEEDAITDAKATARYMAGKFWKELGLPKVQVYKVTCDGTTQPEESNHE